MHWTENEVMSATKSGVSFDEALRTVLFLNAAAERKIPNVSSGGLTGQMHRKRKRGEVAAAAGGGRGGGHGPSAWPAAAAAKGRPGPGAAAPFYQSKSGRAVGFAVANSASGPTASASANAPGLAAAMARTAEELAAERKNGRLWLRPPVLLRVPLGPSDRLVDPLGPPLKAATGAPPAGAGGRR